MKSYILKEINQESFIELETKISEGINTVYLDSPGGSLSHGTLIKNLMQKNDITLVLFYKALSCGFYIFQSYQGPKYMMDGCYGMVHFPQLDISIKKDGKEGDEHDECRANSLKQSSNIDISFMSKREQKNFNEGKDVWFDFKRMKEIFHNVKILS